MHRAAGVVLYIVHSDKPGHNDVTRGNFMTISLAIILKNLTYFKCRIAFFNVLETYVDTAISICQFIVPLKLVSGNSP